MSRPDGEQSPHELDQLIATVEATLNELRARRDADLAAAENIRAEAEVRRRRAYIRLVPPLAAAVVLGRRILTHPAGAAIASSAATAVFATAATLALTGNGSGAPPTAAQPPAVAPTTLPPVGGSPPRVGPPKTDAPIPPTATPPATSPQPEPSPSGDHPTRPPTTPTTDPPTTPPGSGDETTTSGPAPTDTPTCRLYLPHILRRGLLCGRLVD